MLRFVRLLIDLRSISTKNCGRTNTLEDYLKESRIEWHGVELESLTGKELAQSRIVHAQLRMHTGALHRDQRILEALEFELPFVTGVVHGGWLRSMDTSLPTPDDVVAGGRPSTCEI